MSDVVDMPPRGSTRTRAVVLLMALMLASAGAGAVLDRIVVAQRPPIIRDNRFHPLSSVLRSPTDAERRQLRAELDRELDLTAAQDSALDRIMNGKAGEFQALRDEIRPRVELLLADVRREIDMILTPEQRARFHELQQRESGAATREND